jgi:N6-L-threonylcarbamoyladenine synthase
MRFIHQCLLHGHLLARPSRFHGRAILQSRTILTLAIETSCDDTAVAIVEKTGTSAQIHFNERITANQGPFRGIHPILSLESHEGSLADLVQKALHNLPNSIDENGTGKTIAVRGTHGARTLKQLPDFISVTRGPGMRSSLTIGLNIAKGLAVGLQIPVVGVHHMQAHALTPRLVSASKAGHNVEENAALQPSFPYLSLLVSGGHTMLVKSEDLVSHRILVTTSDYAIGDCLDKISRMILPNEVIAASSTPSYGPLLESFAFPNGAEDYDYTPPKSSRDENRLANKSSAFGWYVPSPFVTSRGGSKQNSLEFSFTGVESQTSRICKNGWNNKEGKFSKVPRTEPMSHAEAQCLAREVMRVAFEHMASRILQVLNDGRASGKPQSTALVLSGGVASNKFLRHVMKSYMTARGFGHIDIIAPPIHLCTDNAAMIGWTGCEMWEAGHINFLDIRPLGKWSLENLLSPEKEDDARGWIHNHPDRVPVA